MSFSYEEEYNCPECPMHTKKEAYYFFPNKEQELKVDPDNPGRLDRYIFWKPKLEDYTEVEKNFLKEFTKFYKQKLKEEEEKTGENKESIALPNDFTLEEMMRMIQCGNYDNDKTLSALKTYLSYRDCNIKSDKYYEILNTGFLYQHGLTNNFEPILILKFQYLKTFGEKYQSDDMLVTVDKFLSYLNKHFFIPGQVERWQMIVDLQSFAMPKLDMMKKVLGVLQGKYVCRLNTMYFINPPKGMKILFGLVSAFIDEDTKKKFIFVDKEDISPLFKMINKSQVEEQYGGTAKDITDFTCPFFIPDGDIHVGEPNGKIVTENTYLDLCEGYNVGVISPYAKEEHSHLQKISPLKNLMSDVFLKQEIESNTSKKEEDKGMVLEEKETLPNKCQCKCVFLKLEIESNASKKEEDKGMVLEEKETLANKSQCKCNIF